jgi:hypothetical protein
MMSSEQIDCKGASFAGSYPAMTGNDGHFIIRQWRLQ